jgi:hypothetical protein
MKRVDNVLRDIIIKHIEIKKEKSNRNSAVKIKILP